MKKKFTFLMAAIMLLTMMILPWKAVGQTYTQLSSIADIDENAQYVLGTYESSTYYFHYSGTSSWGNVATPASQTPYYYSLTKGANNDNCIASIVIDNTTYYLSVNNGSNAWSMPTSTTTIYIDEGKIYNSSTNKTRCIQRNTNLRSYTVGSSYPKAYFYKVTQTITFNGNGGSYNNGSSYTQSVNRNYQTALAANQFTKDNCTFAGWNTSAEGNGTPYAEGANVTLTSDLTLYAQWNSNTEPNISADNVDLLVSATSGSIAYTINNEPVGGGAVTAEITTGNVGSWLSLGNVTNSSVALSCSANNGAERSATVTLTYTYNTDQTVTKDVLVTQATSTRTVTYQANDGTTEDVVITYDYGTDVTVLAYDDDEIDFTPPIGKSFKNWKENSTTYDAGDEISSIHDNHILVAQWEDLPTYSLVTSEDDLICGKHYIIVGSRTMKNYAMGSQSSNNRNAVEVAIDNNTIEAVTGIYEFVISGPETIKKNNQNVTVYTIYDVAGNGYLYAAGSGSGKNYLRTEASLDDNGKWTITIDATTNVATITAQGSYTNNQLKKNSSGDLFSCYASGQNDVYLYMKDGDNDCHIYSNTTLNDDMNVTGSMNIHSGVVTVASNKTLTVNGTLTNETAANLVLNDGAQLYTSSNNVNATIKKAIAAAANNSDENWYLISSPVGTVSTNVVTTDHTCNLYAYNEEDLAWNGYAGANGFSSLASGIGYLYRKDDDEAISFAGTVTTGGLSPIALSYERDDAFAGFNLLGNPYSHNLQSNCISLTNGATFSGVYTLGVDGNWYSSVLTDIKPCEGFLVQVDKGTSATFSELAKGTRYNNDYIQFNVANSQYEDVAYALFNDSKGLTKINHRNADIPMLYINKKGIDYAIATMSDDTKSFDLSFKAMTTGKYTLSYKANGEFSYLHIIDRLTGADVDILLEGEYSFIATPTDQNDRFIVKLGYSPEYGDASNDIFAFQSGNEIFVSGSGELQIFDVTGRKVMTTTINGAESISVTAPGIYIFRLVGTEVKTQKIVVR